MYRNGAGTKSLLALSAEDSTR
ncbi:protein of unknown function [Azospirillum baldaniorum]|uniref:Uncharacterized protein n=1 Tax=Azospirillum baldaniorum TaxID=1064539 RepID=A0A9P1JNB5_9PROT|nr:protein of unknown function [Azospirillum baldaniorum]